MLLTHLKQIIDHLRKKEVKILRSVRRCAPNVLELYFEGDYILYADMTKSQSTLFRTSTPACSNRFNAPFDAVLAKYFWRTHVTNIALVDEDKIMRIDVVAKGAYKSTPLSMIFEFTGKYTNVILLDEAGVVLEALRHVDESNSSRPVRVGEKLLAVPKASFVPKEEPIEDVEAWLLAVDTKRSSLALQHSKTTALAQLAKQLKSLERTFEGLENEESLAEQALVFEREAQLVFSHLHAITPYAAYADVVDFEGQSRRITADKPYAKPAQWGNALFAKAKKSRQKVKYMHIEKEHLQAKIDFVRELIYIVEHATSVDAIMQFFPARSQKSKVKEHKPYEIFWFDGYKVLLGRNAKANTALLKDCKANDMWFHLKDRASAHVVIVTDKQKIAPSTIEKAAKLCVDFSVRSAGRYSVDYTKRKEVQVQEGSNVLYNRYETLIVTKE
ncbi:MAG: hypothetical protein KU37_05720 [Sulfuricurvum sp. PC08-66]|nr:MAG: hypothetical protein KU37_05720 [Sulfuricurvum sp. PC08-66]